MDGDNLKETTADDGVYAELERLDQRPTPIDVLQAVTRLRARGLGHECDTLLNHGETAWQQLRVLIGVLQRLDPAWCKLHHQQQPSDEELDLAIGDAEEALSDHDKQAKR